MERGLVKWFNPAADKRYGFIVPLVSIVSGNIGEIFFHFNDGEFIVPGESYPEFSGKGTKKFRDGIRRLRDPKKDDVILFERRPGKKGDKAAPWCYLSLYERAEKIIAARPAPSVYRVLETTKAFGMEPDKPKVLWEGTDLEELLRSYPVPSGNQSPSADSLLPFWADTDNTFEVRHWFERKTHDGWVRCPDPRPLSGVNRQFERISRGR
jgi:cold shock CspA family protein